MLGFFGFYIDPLYLLLVMAPALILGAITQGMVKSAFARASEMGTRRGWTGRDIAQAILDAEGIHGVAIEPVQGYLSDHYDPRQKVLRLSPQVYGGRSIAAAGVAAHEVGHAIQDAKGYAPLAIRNAVVPVASIGSGFGILLAMIGFAFVGQWLGMIGVALFTMVVVFQVVNLPVEFNASARARQTLLANGLVTAEEDQQVKKVLNAAAMTYVAATITAILTLLWLLIRSGVLGGRSSE